MVFAARSRFFCGSRRGACHPWERSPLLHTMPILPKQRDVFPDGLLGAPGSLQDALIAATARWVVFYTLAKREKDLMRKLAAAAIPFYAPLVRRRLHSAGGRVRTSYVPLFPGYVFSLLDDEQRRSALATNTISRWLSVPDERMLEDDLRGIRRLIEADRPLTPESLIQPGQAVRVKSGPLRGLEGTVLKRQGRERLMVAIRFLNQGASIELEDIDVERL